MRILMLAQFYSPIIGGEERLVQDLSIELARRGHQVAVVTLWHEGLPEYVVENEVRIYRIRGFAQRAPWLYSEDGRRHAPPWPDPELVKNLRRVLVLESPDIVHAHNWLLYSFLPLKVWSRARLVVTLHDYSSVCATKRLMYQGQPCSGPGLTKCLTCASRHYGITKGVPVVAANWVMNWLKSAGLVDMYLPISQAVADLNGLESAGLPFQVIPNFVPDDVDSRRDADDPRLTQLPDSDYILWLGGPWHEKVIYTFLEAYSGLTQAPPLVLIGRNYLDAARALPPNVVIVNKWPHTLVMEAWHRSSIALAPSLWPEPFGILVIEAMAAGRAWIA